ncbi:MAG: hypothetical protein ABI191_01200 [Rhizomicrobium sp.]
MQIDERADLIAALEETRALLARPDNDFQYSSWRDRDHALHEINQFLDKLSRGELPRQRDMAILFAPTGEIQEVSLGSGWANEFLSIAERFDGALRRLYRSWAGQADRSTSRNSTPNGLCRSILPDLTFRALEA